MFIYILNRIKNYRFSSQGKQYALWNMKYKNKSIELLCWIMLIINYDNLKKSSKKGENSNRNEKDVRCETWCGCSRQANSLML